jgi:hypothetical protein
LLLLLLLLLLLRCGLLEEVLLLCWDDVSHARECVRWHSSSYMLQSLAYQV